MLLKSLVIQGFKSFPDKTVIQFGNDITAIVGPNGSGKSNISDAISWVMGEQSSKALRGAKMEDVIFGGTLKRPQVGFAEASLILDNSDGALRIETAEVMITRRYYRSGESEYYINKQSARLRDINELFMDTGLGREGYSNIGQGRIDEILSLKSTDRREVFEEAAGISKFRHRKEETERRLADAQENLLRVGDKIAELELQVEPLREQAEKAQKYLAFRAELKSLEVTVWLDSLEKLSATAKKADEDYRAAAFILEQAHSSLDALYQTVENLGAELHDWDEKMESLREEIAEQEEKLRQGDGEIAVLQANVENNQRNMQRVREELSDQQNRSSGISAQIAQRQERLNQLQQQQAETEKHLESWTAQGQALAGQMEKAAAALATLQAEQAGKQTKRDACQAELENLRASGAEQAARRAELETQQREADAKLAKTLEEQASCTKKLQDAREAVVSAQNTIAGYQLRMQTRVQKRDNLQKAVSAASIELDTLHSRIQMFQEMEREFEGYSKAVRVVMQEAQRGALRNVHGPVSQLLKTEDDYTVAIETALGAAMQQIVVSAEEDGKAAIQMLKRKDAGRATFLPLRTIQGRRLQERGLEGHTGFVGIAADLVRYEKQYEGIFQNLLGRTVVVENLDHAIAMARAYQNRFRIVTLDGQVLNAGGSMTGGSAARSAGILSRANELRRLETQRESAEKKHNDLSAELAEATRLASEVEFQMSAVQGQLRQAEDEVLRLEGEEKQRALLVEAAELQVQSCRDARAALDSDDADSKERQKVLVKDMETLQAEILDLESTISQRSAELAELETQNTQLQEEMTAGKVQSAAWDAERTTVLDSMEQLQALARDMEGDRSSRAQLLARYEEENQQFETQIAGLREQSEATRGVLDGARDRLKQAISDRAQVEARKTKTEKEAQDKNKDIVLMERESARLEQRKATAALEEKQILDKLWDSYELTPTTATGEVVAVESMAAANKEIAQLKRRISALGTPNLGAIEEHARVSERYDYLCTQRDDVQQSKSDLEEIIRSITREMTEIFVREFQRIDEYFGKTFTEMFGGGKASLVLDDPDDPLGCGIEIRVQPPGKQLKTITLLSGGEKAFVAIALYFAILRVRPTPFCLLDEIDAALDDNNVHRFASYLRNLSDNTQFIVITHRRGTMEAADVLYGVTMQEQGVSTILHINLGQMEQQLGIQ